MLNLFICYGLITYGCTSKTNLNKILVLQKRIVRTILCLKKFDSVTPILSAFGIDTVFDLYFDQLLKETFSQIRGLSPLSLLNFQELRNRRSTRAHKANILNLPGVRTTVMANSLELRITKFYNFLAQNSLIPDNIHLMSHAQIYTLQNNLKKTFLTDNRSLFDTIFK